MLEHLLTTLGVICTPHPFSLPKSSALGRHTYWISDKEMMEPVQAFRHSISQFAFTPSPTSTPLKCSSPLSVPAKDRVVCQSQSYPEAAIKSSKGKRLKGVLDLDGSTPKQKRRVSKRGYADPETYTHLNGLSDHLAPFLDGDSVKFFLENIILTRLLGVVLFCGIKWDLTGSTQQFTEWVSVLVACQQLKATIMRTLRTIFGKAFISLVRSTWSSHNVSIMSVTC